MQMKRTIVQFGMALSLLVSAAQIHAEAPTISGFLDTTYTYDTLRPISRTTALRSFDRKTDTFLLNAAQVNISGSKDGIGYYAELAFGTDPSVYKAAGTGADAGVSTPATDAKYNFELQEAYLTYKCSMTGLNLKAGKFVTFEGIEVIEGKDNFTITRGHLFGLAEPYGHVGALLGYQFPKVIDLWVGVTNGWDVHTDNNTGKTFLAKVGIAPCDMISGSISMTRGAEKANNTGDARTSIDTTWMVKPISKLSVALQANAGEEEKSSIDTVRLAGAGHWYGFGIQPKVDINEKLFVGSRYEWFSDLDGARTGTTQVVQNITLAPGVNLTEALMVRVEYRYDWSSRLVYETSASPTSTTVGDFSKGETSTFGLQFVYKF